LAKNKPGICAAIINDNLAAVKGVEPLVDLLEVRVDLIGSRWPELVKHLEKPWIACNRRAQEGGRWQGSESKRIDELLPALARFFEQFEGAFNVRLEIARLYVELKG
jgi:3-dehydroquinate dehydratase